VDQQTFRILSLDGGGIMGAFSASALATFERVTGQRIVEHFDLITGTSTGGIIAIGLAMGASAPELCPFYETEGPKIFPPRRSFERWLRLGYHLFRPRYWATELRRAIQSVVGEHTLGEAQTRLVIPAIDINTGKIYLFKTPHHRQYLHHADLPAVDAALATSAAPSYFPAHTIKGRGSFVDGGLWANCPTMVGLVEALDFLNQRLEHIKMLSISTTSSPFRIRDPYKPRGLGHWAWNLRPIMSSGQTQSAVNSAFCLLKQGLFHRIDFPVPAGSFALDDPRTVGELINMGRQIAELKENMVVVAEHFLNGTKVEPFRPSV
jgi:uncharacterized protein